MKTLKKQIEEILNLPITKPGELIGTSDLVEYLLSLFLSTLSGLKAMEEEKHWIPGLYSQQIEERNQLRQQILKELKAELKEVEKK